MNWSLVIKRFVLASIVFLFLTSFLNGQNGTYRIHLLIIDLPEDQIFRLISIKGNALEPVDSFFSQNGAVDFVYSKPLPRGQYSITWQNNQKFIDFLFNNEHYIELHTNHKDPIQNLKVISSEENKYFVKFLKIKDELYYLIDMGDEIYSKNPKDPLLGIIIDKIDSINNELSKFIKNVPEEFLAYKVIKANIHPSLEEFNKTHPNNRYNDIKSFYKRHWFDNIDKQDSALVNTPVIYEAVKFYLQNLVEPPDTEQYKKAVDFILSQFSWNEQQYKYVLNLLLNTFYTPQYESVFLYIYFNYMHDTQCSASVSDENYRKAMMITKLSKGAEAPELTGITLDSDSFRLSNITNKPVLLIFWAPDCYHCKSIMPYINNLYEKYGDDIYFVSFSIDTNVDAIKKATKEDSIKFTVITDLQGYNGENCLRWYIWGTPTFFIIDKNGKIYSSPYSFEGLENDIKTVLLN
ncbi:MAG: redoxin domain-containing protein [Bacteroidales bacterium]|jgi:thiol-disulfide isomerase/thioredoxin|nr:redoxin domain-containing protein [Bacteroidales bacterium]MDD3755301.1 redoxin domain-containing protein [Bacteroidales bacterium]HHW58852.1 redoxin domain-containing protein [Bacteroidales bacterium]